MNATGKSRFTERILRIAGLSPKRDSRPNWLIIVMLPLLLALGSWWPMQATPTPANHEVLELATPSRDSLPPQKAVRVQPSAQLPAKADSGSGDVSTTEDIKGPELAISLVKMNVMYIGVDNLIQVAATGVPSKDLQIQLIGNGTITGGDGEYIVRPTTPGEITIRVLRKVNNQTATIDDQKYRVKRIPDPSARLGGIYKGGLITKEELLKNKGITALLENFDFDAVCNVVSYEMTVMPKDQNPMSVHVTGSAIGGMGTKALEALQGDGDLVFFDDIKVQCPGDINPRNLGGIAFKLKAETAKE